MAFLNFLTTFFSIDMAKGLWEWLIGGVFDFIPNYGLRVIIFTLLLKLLLFPLDLYQRKITRDNAAKMERMKPELAKLQEQYANDRATLGQKQMALYKKEKYSMFSACLPMIATMAIFLTLYSGFTNISSYMSAQTVETLTTTYTRYHDAYYYNDSAYLVGETGGNRIYNVDILQQQVTLMRDENDKALELEFAAKYKEVYPQANDEEIAAATAEAFSASEADLQVLTLNPNVEGFDKDEFHKEIINKAKESMSVSKGQGAVAAHYYGKDYGGESFKDDKQEQGFLWIKSIWVADTPFSSPISDWKGFEGILNRTNLFGTSAGKNYLKLEDENGKKIFSKEKYNLVMGGLITENNGKANGYLVMVVLAAGLSFLTQFVSQKLQKGSQPPTAGGGQGMGAMNTTMKTMMFMMPVMMGFFAFTSASAFTIYLVSNSSISLLLMIATNLILKAWDKHKEKKELETVHVLRKTNDGGSKKKGGEPSYSRYNVDYDKAKKQRAEKEKQEKTETERKEKAEKQETEKADATDEETKNEVGH